MHPISSNASEVTVHSTRKPGFPKFLQFQIEKNILQIFLHRQWMKDFMTIPQTSEDFFLIYRNIFKSDILIC